MDAGEGAALLYNELLRNLKTALEAIGLLASNRRLVEDDFTAPVLDGARWTEEGAVGVGVTGGLDAVNNFYEISGTAVGGAASDSIIVDAATVVDWKVPHLIRWTQRLSGTPAAGGGIRFHLQIADGTLNLNIGARKIDAGADSVLYYKNGAGSETDLDATNNTAEHAYMVLITPNAVGPFQTVSMFVDGVFKGTTTANFTANLTIRWMASADAAADALTADQNYYKGVLINEYDPTILSDILAAVGGTLGVAEGGTTTTLIDAHLTQVDDYWNGQCLVMRTGLNAGTSRRIVDFDNATDTITVDPAFTGGAIAAGDEYTIKDPTNAPTVDSAVVTTMEATVGNKGDTVLYAISGTASALAYLKGVMGKLGAAYVNAGGNPDVDTVRAHLRAGLLNGTGTVVPANKSLYDLIGADYVDAGGNPDVDNVRNHLRAGLHNGTGTAVPANKALYDLLGVQYADSGVGNPDIQSVGEHLTAGLLAGAGTVLPADTSIYEILGTGYVAGGGLSTVDSIRVHLLNGLLQAGGTSLPAAKALYDILGTAYVAAGGNPDVDTLRAHIRAGLLNGTGTAVAANKSLVDAIGHTGAASLATGIDADTQYISRVDPGAGVAGSITARVGQTNDAGVDPDGGAGSLHGKVSGLGARVGDSGDTQANATVFGDLAVPTADVATNTHARDVIGNKSDAAVAAPSASASIVAYLKGILNSVGTGVAGTADAGSTASLLVDAARTEAAADYWVGGIVVMEDGANAGLARSVVDFDPATDTLTVSPAFPSVIGIGDSYNLLPQATVNEIVLALNAAGVSITTNSLADQLYIGAGEQLRTFIAKTGATAVPATKGLYDIVGADYVDAAGNPDVDNVRNHLRAGLHNGTGTAVPANKGLYDVIGADYVDAAGNPDVDNVRNHLRAGLLNGAGTVVPANIGLYDVMGTSYTGTAAAATTSSIRRHLLDGVLQTGGTSLPASKALYDVLGASFVAAGGNPDVDTIRAMLRAYLGNGAAASLAAGKSLIDALGHDGTTNNDVGLAALLNDCWRRQPVTTFTAANVGSGATQNMLAIGAVGGTIGYRLDGGFVNVSGMGSNTNITITAKVEINGVETTYDTVIRGATGVVSLVALLGSISSRRILITVTGDNAANDGTVSASFETSLAGV